eukprot:s3839_g12.t1
MPIIEEVDDEDYVDLIGMFEDLAHDWSVRAVKMTESEQLVKVANMADGSDEEEYERDEPHKWYEDLEVDKLNSKKAKSGENILRWDETKQDWMVQPFEIPSPGFTDSEEEIDLSKQDWLEKPVEIPSPGHQVRAVSARYSELVEVVLDSGADCHVLPLSYYSEDLGSEEVYIDLAKEHSVIITILERKSVGLDEYGDYERPVKPSEEPSAGSAEKKKTVEEMEEENRQAMEELFPSQPPKEGEGEWKIIEEKLPSLGERMEEAMVVAGVELTPDSTLKKLRTACEFLKIGKTGSKAQVWQRLKQAVSANKMKELVEISKGLEVEFSREPKGEKRPEEPTEEERRKHELTHLPKADWCESCQATRKELPKYHDDEEVDLDEFENIEAEIEEDEWWCESDGEEEIPEGMPTWSNDFESGPPKIEGVASTVKLLSALFSSSEGYSLGSIDVGDAYLMVEQEEPTVVEVDGEYYELGFTLPGQRIGSSAWFNKLKGYLEEYGMKSDDGLPALFSKMPNKDGKGIILLTHVDDMELYASKEDFEKLVEFLKSKGLKLKVEGPLDEKEGSIGFLKRSFKSTHEGDVEMTMNSKYIEGLVEVLKLEGAYPKRLPCPSDNGRSFQTKKDGMNPLSAEDHHTYRKGVGILLYLAPERPDIMYVLKKLSTKLS